MLAVVPRTEEGYIWPDPGQAGVPQMAVPGIKFQSQGNTDTDSHSQITEKQVVDEHWALLFVGTSIWPGLGHTAFFCSCPCPTLLFPPMRLFLPCCVFLLCVACALGNVRHVSCWKCIIAIGTFSFVSVATRSFLVSSFSLCYLIALHAYKSLFAWTLLAT